MCLPQSSIRNLQSLSRLLSIRRLRSRRSLRRRSLKESIRMPRRNQPRRRVEEVPRRLLSPLNENASLTYSIKHLTSIQVYLIAFETKLPSRLSLSLYLFNPSLYSSVFMHVLLIITTNNCCFSDPGVSLPHALVRSYMNAKLIVH